MTAPAILRPAEITPRERGGGARTIPLVNARIGSRKTLSGITEFEAVSWYALMAVAHTPKAIIDKLNGAVAEVLKSPEVVAAMSAQGAQAIGGSPAELAAVIAADTRRWSKLIKDAGIQVN